MNAVEVVEDEVRELVRRRGLDPSADGPALRRLVEEVITDYDERTLSSSLPPLPDALCAARSVWETDWRKREDFYIDAVAEDRRTVAILADTDIWGVERFHAQTPREYDQRPQCEIRCCGGVRPVRGYPCNDCGEPYCPKCGRCRCDRRAAAAVLCAGGCYMKYQAHLLVSGLCEDCR